MSDLLTCPFCGGEAEVVEWEESNYPTMSAYVECNCGVKGPTCGANNRLGCYDAEKGLHRSRAIAAWNTRAALADLKGESHDCGGPAFPQLEPNSAYFNATGMSLRDWFAGQAISGVKGWHPADRRGKNAAQIAYEIADDMLEARK